MQFRFRRPSRTLDHVIWVVAMASMAESGLQAFDARLQGSVPRFVLWLAGSGFIGLFAVWAETLKRRAEG